jgi:hypothetical protein
MDNGAYTHGSSATNPVSSDWALGHEEIEVYTRDDGDKADGSWKMDDEVDVQSVSFVVNGLRNPIHVQQLTRARLEIKGNVQLVAEKMRADTTRNLIP